MPILRRLAEIDRPTVAFTLDGEALQALQGDTVLTAVLTQAERVRFSEFNATPRAGFCMMGACQDCWMQLEDGSRVRACSTFIAPGMRLVTTRPATDAATTLPAAWPEGDAS